MNSFIFILENSPSFIFVNNIVKVENNKNTFIFIPQNNNLD
jgi:hypothetical protein